jgi:hypothetical protein
MMQTFTFWFLLVFVHAFKKRRGELMGRGMEIGGEEKKRGLW